MKALITLLLPLFAQSVVDCCSASGRHPHYLRNTPALFTYNNLTKADQLCSAQLKGRSTLSCRVVSVNLQSFLAQSLTVPVTPDPTVTNSVHEEEEAEDLVLVKRMELGLQLAMQDAKGPGTAQVQYTSKAGNVVFVIKSRHVYGSIAQDGFSYSLEPCLGDSVPANESCHLWVKTIRKKQRV